MKNDEILIFAVDFYNDIGCYDEATRVISKGLDIVDYDKVGFEEDLCTTDIDIILEEEEYVFKRDIGEIVNSSRIRLFSKEWLYE